MRHCYIIRVLLSHQNIIMIKPHFIRIRIYRNITGAGFCPVIGYKNTVSSILIVQLASHKIVAEFGKPKQIKKAAPAGIYVVTTIMFYTRPHTVSTDILVITDTRISSLSGIKSADHSLYRLKHCMISPPSRCSPRRILIVKIIRFIAIFSDPPRFRTPTFLHDQVIVIQSLSQHARVIFFVCNISRPPV